MNIVDLSIKRPVMVLMGLIALVLFGVMAYLNMPLALIPDVKMPMVTVQTVYAGASPDIIENQISKKVEDAVSSISEIDTIESYSMDSFSMVTIQFKQSKDENVALNEVKEKVDAIADQFPSDAKKPVMSKMNVATLTPIMSLVLEGDMTESELYHFATETVKNRLSQISGIGSVEIKGGAEREIQVGINRSTVYERQIALSQIAGIIAAANVDMPGGNVTIDNQDIPVQLKGVFTNLDDLKNLDVPTQTGIFKLHQLAYVTDTSKTVRERTILLDKEKGTRNENAILLQIVKNPSGNTVDVISGVMKELPEIEKMSGGHVSFKVVSEDKTYVQDTINDTLSNVYLGILLTGLVILIFLHDWRSTLIVALAMPFSLVATFFVMQWLGIGFNLFSLTGLSSATGTLVANSVVVIENIFKHKARGEKRIDAASNGSKEVITAVFASTLTNIAVFLPLATVQSAIGSVLTNFALTTVIATVFSLVVSFTLTPMMASKIIPEGETKTGRIGQLIDKVLEKITGAYRWTLEIVLKKKRRSTAVIAGAFALLLISFAFAGKLGFELLPATDGGKIQLNIECPQGTDLGGTAALFKTVEDRLAAHKEVKDIETILGSTGTTDQDVCIGQMFVYLVPRSKRSKSNMILATEYAKELSDIAGAKISVSSVSELSFSGVNLGMDLFLKGDDIQTLQYYADQIQTLMKTIPGISNVSLSSKSGKQELQFIPDRKQISSDGLTVQEIAVAMRCGIDGYVMTKYKENGNEYDIRLKLNDSSLTDINDIRNIPIVSRAGTYPLSRYAAVKFEPTTNKIIRSDKIRTIEVTADILPGYSLGNVQAEVLNLVKEKILLPNGYSFAPAGMSKMMTDMVYDLIRVFAIAIVVIYMLLAATLENFRQPLFILSTVPLAIIGVILSLVMTGAVLNIVSMLGVIMLVGIVVNNSIIILDEYNVLKRGGLEAREALLEACSGKLKAILMSNIAIILGMVPMAMGMGASGAELRQPMGIVIIGGVITSTILTMYVTPALEFLATKIGKKMEKEIQKIRRTGSELREKGQKIGLQAVQKIEKKLEETTKSGTARK